MPGSCRGLRHLLPGSGPLQPNIAPDPSALRQPVNEIKAGIWAAAHCIGLWFLDEAVPVQRAAVENPTLEIARRTLAWLGRRDEQTISMRTLRLYGPRPQPDAKTAAAVSELLENLGWLTAMPVPGRRKRQYCPHPRS